MCRRTATNCSGAAFCSTRTTWSSRSTTSATPARVSRPRGAPTLLTLAGADLDDTLTVERTQHPGWSLQRKVKHTLKMRVHPLLLDENVTRPATARRNLFGACLLAALKLRAHARRLPHVNSAFLAHVVFGCVDYAWALLRALPHSGAAAQHGAHSSIRQREAECLSLAAFAHALAASPHRAVLARLRARLARARAACPLLAPLLAEECAAADAVLARRAPPQ